MSFGPITIFDKSFLQSINPNESVWLDMLYRSNITPLFFVETLANLGKSTNLNPSKLVRDMAIKIPLMGSNRNMHHSSIATANMLGEYIEIRGVPIINPGKQIKVKGKSGLYVMHGPEDEAFNRWKDKQFLEVEQLFAKEWRKALTNIDLEKVYKNTQSIFAKYQKPKNLQQVKELVEDYMGSPENKSILFNRALFHANPNHQSAIIRRWKLAREPFLFNFAVYANYIVGVDLFFEIALGADLISRDRKTNKIDMAYLYYIPFCNIFVSGDNLHERLAPYLITETQEFIKARDLKDELGI